MGILDSYLCFSAAICNEWSKQFYIYWLLGTSSYKLTYFGKFCYSKHKPYCLLAKVLGFLGSYCAHSLGNLCDNPSLSLLLLKQQSQKIWQKLFCSYLFEPFRTTASLINHDSFLVFAWWMAVGGYKITRGSNVVNIIYTLDRNRVNVIWEPLSKL